MGTVHRVSLISGAGSGVGGGGGGVALSDVIGKHTLPNPIDNVRPGFMNNKAGEVFLASTYHLLHLASP